METSGNLYLPRIQLPAEFLSDLRHSLEQFAIPPSPIPPAPSVPIPPELARSCSLIALVADVEASSANINVVLEDLDKLDRDFMAFSDASPAVRYKFLLRSAEMELERLSAVFAQFLRLFAASRKLTDLELYNLQNNFGGRVHALFAVAKADQLNTAHGYQHLGGLDTLLRGIAYMQSQIEDTPPNRAKAANWAKAMRTHCRASRQDIFDAGMRVVRFWSGAVELVIFQLDIGPNSRYEVSAEVATAEVEQITNGY